MYRSHALFRVLFVAIIMICAASPANAQAPPPPDLHQKIDTLVMETLARSGVPGASVAVVKDGHIAYVRAYGDARIEPHLAAGPEMRYSIGSISKQFTACAILLLEEEGKLSLDERVARFIPHLTRAKEVTIRQLLSHTSGYQDYWPQDYVMPPMLRPVTPERILDGWACKPLDFDPGTKWQYSNTNFVIAGMIVEKASGMSLLAFLEEKVFGPLGMKSVRDIDHDKPGETDPTGYMRYGLGPLHPAPKEGRGWLFAAGELAMSAEDLARWDISLMEANLMGSVSYRQLETEVLLASGVGTHYGLGIGVVTEGGHRALWHNGEVSGFTAENIVLPDDRAAVVVLTNQDAVRAASTILHGITAFLTATDDTTAARRQEQARRIFDGLQRGTIDRTLFTDDANAYFGDQALKDFAGSLAPLGEPQEFRQTSQSFRGGMTLRNYRVRFADKTLRVWTYEMPDGKLEQYQVAQQD